MAEAGNFPSQADSVNPTLPLVDNISATLESLGSAQETERDLRNLSFFQVASSPDSMPLDVELDLDANAPIPSIPSMDSDVDCACE